MGRNKSKAFLKKQASKRQKKKQQKTISNKKTRKSLSNQTTSIKKMNKFNAQFNEELLNAQNPHKNIAGINASTFNFIANAQIFPNKMTTVQNTNNNNQHHHPQSQLNINFDDCESVQSDDSYNSLQSAITIVSDDILNINDERDAYFELNENFQILITGNNSSNERIAALEHINHAFRRRLFNDYLQMQDRMNTLYVMLVSCVRRRDNVTEQLKALDTIGLVCISLQSDYDFFVRNFQPILLNIIQKPTSQRVQIKVCLYYFVCSLFCLCVLFLGYRSMGLYGMDDEQQ